MIRDERGLPLSTNSAEAASLFDRTVEHWLKFHNDTMALAGRMLAADPHFVLGHCFKGYLLLSASNPAFRAEIATTLAAAEAGAAVGWPPRHRRRDHRRGNPDSRPTARGTRRLCSCRALACVNWRSGG